MNLISSRLFDMPVGRTSMAGIRGSGGRSAKGKHDFDSPHSTNRNCENSVLLLGHRCQ